MQTKTSLNLRANKLRNVKHYMTNCQVFSQCLCILQSSLARPLCRSPGLLACWPPPSPPSLSPWATTSPPPDCLMLKRHRHTPSIVESPQKASPALSREWLARGILPPHTAETSGPQESQRQEAQKHFYSSVLFTQFPFFLYCCVSWPHNPFHYIALIIKDDFQ